MSARIINLILLYFLEALIFVECCDVNRFTRCLKSRSHNLLVVFRNDAQYDSFNVQINFRDYVYPTAYIQPKNTRDVQITVSCAAIIKCWIVPKSGGHSYEKYSYGTNSSFIIDLSKFKSININRKSKTAVFGPSVTLGQAYYHIWKNGRFAIPAGLCPSVGFGGHVLGGGYGLSARKYGMLSDNVISFEVVTANGNIVTANMRQNKDLFWALRGAGNNNFGIVTSITMKLHSVEQNVTIIDREYHLEDFFDVFTAYQLWARSNPNRSVTADVLVWLGKVHFFAVINNSNQRVHRKIVADIYKRFPNRHIKETLKSMQFIEMVAYFSVMTDALQREVTDVSKMGTGEQVPTYYKIKSYYVRRVANFREVQRLAALMAKVPDGVYVLFEMQGGAINDLRRGDTAFFHRGNLYGVMIGYETLNTTNEVESLKWMNRVFDESKSFDSGYSFFNFVDADLKMWRKRYWGSNYHRLQRIKSKYDPNLVFHYSRGVTPREEPSHNLHYDVKKY